MNWFWSKYDKLNEPYRFFVAMILLSPIWSMNIVLSLSMHNILKIMKIKRKLNKYEF